MDKINILAKLASCVNAAVYVADFVIRHWFAFLISAALIIGVMMAHRPSVECSIEHSMELIGDAPRKDSRGFEEVKCSECNGTGKVVDVLRRTATELETFLRNEESLRRLRDEAAKREGD